METLGQANRTAATLVVAPNWVGDLVMAEPVFRALASSGRELVVLARPSLSPLVSLLPGVVAVIPRPKETRQTIERLARLQVAEAVVLPHSFRSAWWVARAGIPSRFGYRGDGRAWLLRPAVARPRGIRPQVEDYRELLEAMRVSLPDSWVPRLEVPESLRAQGLERWARAGISIAESSPKPRLVGLLPAGEWGPSKRWPWQHFVELARLLRQAQPQVRIAILCGPKELWTAVRIREETGNIHPVVGPELDLAGLAAVLAHLDVAVTNDSGPMHLAAALGVPTVALFGPTDPRRTAPPGSHHQVLTRNLWCSPCFFRRCPLLYHGCLRLLEPRVVLEAIQGVLQGKNSG
jgi:heptosyltransferase-2